MAFAEGVAHVSVPTKFLKSWIQSHYLDRMIAILTAEVEGIRAVSIGVRTSSRNAVGRVARPFEPSSEQASSFSERPVRFETGGASPADAGPRRRAKRRIRKPSAVPPSTGA